eukprot:m.120443 g.120443  ORF g.120443 m.120443 type:complete len:456 (+) comp13690_c0_seq1:60-1427(+)
MVLVGSCCSSAKWSCDDCSATTPLQTTKVTLCLAQFSFDCRCLTTAIMSDGKAQTRQPRQGAQPQVQDGASRQAALERARRAQLEYEQERQRQSDLKYGADSVLALIKPVSACMVVVIATIRSVSYFSVNDVTFAYTPFEPDDPNATSGQKLGGALLNTMIVIAIVIVMTFILLLLYKYRCYKVIHGWLLVSSLLLLFFFSYDFVSQVLVAYNKTLDWVTMAVLIWNFGTVGLVCIHWKGPLLLQQLYLVAVSSLMALILIKNLPDWTTWILLGAIAIYDLFAVLSPCGPLKALVETAQERDEPLFPALIYSSTMAWIVTMADTDTPPSTAGQEVAMQDVEMQESRGPSRTRTTEVARQQPEEEENSGVKLGLGDFIFYSVLVGKAATADEWTTILACYVGILVGLACTLLLLSIYQKALPALPISIAFGLVFYFVTAHSLDPLTNALNMQQIIM